MRSSSAVAPRAQLVPHRVAVCQSNYIPWKGYFDLIRSVDTFVIYDIAQFTKNDWRNRNQIRTNAGLHWLTIPVQRKDVGKTILETRVASSRWARKHRHSIEQWYRQAPYFESYIDDLRSLYLELEDEPFLHKINRRFLTHINTLLGIHTTVLGAEDFILPAGRNERLITLLDRLGTTDYLTGPAARSYLDRDLFQRTGINVHFADYGGYPTYSQLQDPFIHEVSILDLVLNTGPDATRYMKDQLRKRKSPTSKHDSIANGRAAAA